MKAPNVSKLGAKNMSDSEQNKDSYATVGELILIANALDYQLAEVVISVLNLGRSIMLMPVVTTLDPARKIEILKANASHISQKDWKNGVTKYVDKVERVLRYRNIACHSQLILEAGEFTLRPFAAAKVFKNIDVKNKTLKSTTMKELKEAISSAEAALGAGENLMNNFQLLMLNGQSERRNILDLLLKASLRRVHRRNPPRVDAAFGVPKVVGRLQVQP
jgi:hypothetical protein